MAKSNDAFVSEIAKISPDIEIVGKYTRAHDRIEVKCSRCGYEWQPLAYSLSMGKGCPHCSAMSGAAKHTGKTARKTHETFVAEMATIHPSIKVLSEYINGHTDVECLCEVCSHKWLAKPYSLLQNHGCPRCAKSGTSFMEQYIRLCFSKALGEHAVYSRDKTAIGMELDVYIPSLSLAIEPGNWFLHKRSFERDHVKRKKCEEKGIRLITIYDKYPQGKLLPFDKDCYVFCEDLNKADHSILRNLILQLFELAGLRCAFVSTDWETIELEAYSKAKAKNHDDFLKELSTLNPNIEVLETYKNANIQIRAKCKICGHEWDAVPANLLVGDGCRKCGTKKAHEKFIKNQQLFAEQVLVANPDIEIVGEYTGRHNPVKARCRICGHEWEPRASSLLRGSNHKGWQSLHAKMQKISTK